MIIYKYPLQSSGETEIFTYRDGKILSAGEQDNKLVLWIAVDIHEAPVVRVFRVFNTGEEITHSLLRYVSTVQKSNGYVKHIFEIL